MSVFITENFESGLGAWTLTGTPVTDGAAAYIGVSGLLIDTVAAGATKYIQQVPAAGTRVIAAGFYLRTAQRPGTTQNILTCGNPNGQAKLIMLASGALRIQFGSGATITSAVLNLNQWYRIDIVFDCSGATAQCQWQIDSVSQTTLNNTQAASDFTNFRLGLQGSTTALLYFDQLLAGNALGDYPLGAAGGATSGVATGTGSALNASISIKTSAGQATGVGSAPTGNGSDLISEARLASGSGTAYNPTIQYAVAVAAGVAQGTGAALTARGGVGAAAGNAAGAGAAGAPGGKVSTPSGVALGTGAAGDSKIALGPTAGNAVGTGTAQDGMPGGVRGTALTVIMG